MPHSEFQHRFAIAAVLVSLGLGCTQTSAQPDRQQSTAPAATTSPEIQISPEVQAKAIEVEAVRAFRAGEWSTAATLFEQQRELTPGSHIVHFNLACTRALLGELEEAETRIRRAIELGFDDVHTFRFDPGLGPLREREVYTSLLNQWPQILEQRRESILTRDRGWTKGRYVERTLDGLRLEIRSAHGDEATDLALADLQRVANFLIQELFPELPEEPWLSHSPWVVVTLPNTRDFAVWAQHAVGGGSRGLASVGGAYDHTAKRLVAQDLGPTLWHEFAHTLHYRDTDRHYQQHTLWITEGLGALVEVFRVRGETIEPIAGWRINSLKRANDRGLLGSVQALAELTPAQFSGSQGLRNYAHARAVMLLLHERGQLKAFYDAYVEGFEADPSGMAALQTVTGETVAAFDEALAAWLDRQPMVAETLQQASTTIAAGLDNGSGDGPKVTAFGDATKGRDGLKLGSVITHVNGQPTRDLRELARVLDGYSPGSSVTLTTRRGKLIRELTTTLVAPE